MGKGDFAPFAAKMAAAGMPQLAIDVFGHYHAQLGSGVVGKVPSADLIPVDDVPDVVTLARYQHAGIASLGQAVVIKLNGGLGTTMGLTRAKSLLPVKGELTFLDIIVRQVLHLRKSYAARLPLVLMNSFRTRADSQAVLARYPELDRGLPLDFLQHQVPRILASDGSPVSWPRQREHEWCPPGHGDIYPALRTSGLLRTLLDAGIEYAFISNADNLGATLDLAILGWVARDNIPFVMEVADRTEADRKGGHLSRRRSDGRLMLRESAQCPDEPAEVAEFQDVRRHRFFNTNSLWVNLRALDRVLDATGGVLGLPMITNRKPVDPEDPASPQVIQLETAMGAAISVFEGAQALRVDRSRFVPVKSTSDLLGLWSDVYVLTDDAHIVVAPERTAGDLLVDLDPRYFRQVQDLRSRFAEGPPSLLQARRFVVRGDVRFGGGVVVVGDVQIEHAGPEPLVIAAGTRLRG